MDPLVLRLLLVIAGLAVVVAAGAWWQRRDGRLKVTAPADAASTADTADERHRLTDEQLHAVGLELTEATAGAVLLGSPTCAPCTVVKRILGEVADQRDGFRWVYADAADHLDLAREHRVLRVPTLFVVDGEGHILARTSGVPAQDDLTAVLDRGADLDDVAA